MIFNRRRLSVLALTCGLAQASATPAWPRGKSQADILLDSAEKIIHRARDRAERRLGCGSDTAWSPERLLAHAETIADPSLRSEFIRPALADLFRYYYYSALDASNAELCSPLKVVTREGRFAPPWEDKRFPADRYCRRVYHEMAFARALISRSQDFPRFCAEQLAFEISLPAEKASAVCADWARDYKNPTRACARLDFYKMREDDPPRKCEIFMRSFAGSALGCPALTCPSEHIPEIEYPDGENHYEVRERCRAYAAFSKASASGKASACGDSEICLALMGRARELAESRRPRIELKACAMKTSLKQQKPVREAISEASREYEKEIKNAQTLLESARKIPDDSARTGDRITGLNELIGNGLPRRLEEALTARPERKLP